MEFHLFLPQLRLSFERLAASAQAAEAAGFRGIAGMDHLAPPGADGHPTSRVPRRRRDLSPRFRS